MLVNGNKVLILTKIEAKHCPMKVVEQTECVGFSSHHVNIITGNDQRVVSC